VLLLAIVLASAEEEQLLRTFHNPLNQNSVDVYLVVDTSSKNLNNLQFGQVKIALNNIIQDLSVGLTRIGIVFYGTFTSVDIVHAPTNETEIIEAIKTKIAQKQYVPASPTASTLAMALDEVNRLCGNYCRSKISRVTVILTSEAELVGRNEARQLETERQMTIVVVGVGNRVNSVALAGIASEPSTSYSIELDSYSLLAMSTQYITSLITSIPRFLAIGEQVSNYEFTKFNVYHTLQIDTSLYTSSSDSIIFLDIAYTAGTSTLYTSLTEPIPTIDNSNQAQLNDQRYFDGQYHLSYYFYSPKSSRRLYLSFIASSTETLTYQAFVVNVPIMKKNVANKFHNTIDFSDLASSIG